jgi:ribosome-associated translation inhibitor RaiA
MQIDVHANTFDLTSHMRGFVESRVQSALGRFRGRVKSVAVHLETPRSRIHPDIGVCGIVVSLHPSGQVRSRVEHPWMQVAINRAALGIADEVERDFARTRPAVAPLRLHDQGLEVLLDENRPSHHPSETLERRDNIRRLPPVRELWKPPGAEDVRVPNARRSDRLHRRLRPESGGPPGPLTRLVDHRRD